MRYVTIGVAAALFALFAAGVARAETADDRYIAGYAAAVLEREFEVTAASLRVRDGVVTIASDDLVGTDRERIIGALSAVPGVKRVELAEEAEDDGGPLVSSGRPTKVRVSSKGGKFLPRGVLFAPLLADPRWPHFSATYQNYVDDPELENVGAPNFGITFGLYENDFPGAGRWQLGLQAGVFAIFDLDAPSSDLINADYLAALPLSYRAGPFSGIFRFFHQSSHLGDEFLLRNRIDRVNLSYEGVDLRLSLDFLGAFRLYGGGGYLVRVEPSDIERASSQGGLEIESPWTFFAGTVRPIAGVDVQNREEADWRTDFSGRAGVQLESGRVLSHEIQILAEYFDGRSPNGQFYDREIEYYGVGVHLQFVN